MFPRILLSICFLAAYPLIAIADTYSDCDAAIVANDQVTAQKLAQTILRFRYVTAPEQQNSGIACISFALGEQYAYSSVSSQFASKAVVDAELASLRQEADERAEQIAKREANELEQRRQERLGEEAEAAMVRAVWLRVAKACDTLFANDPTAALTNKVCVDVFLQTGLPPE